MSDCDSESYRFKSCYLPLDNLFKITLTLDWAQKRFKILNQFSQYFLIDIFAMLKFLHKFRAILYYWFLYNLNLGYINYFKNSKILKSFERKEKLLKKLFFFLLKYNGLYNKKFLLNFKINFFFKERIYFQHPVLSFIFTSQQIFFQIFTETASKPDTHATVGTLIKIRENIREHSGVYVYREDESEELEKKYKLYDKKPKNYFVKSGRVDNFRELLVSKKLVKPQIMITKAAKLLQAKKNLVLKKKKTTAKLDNFIFRNKRGNAKTEPAYGKCQRRKFMSWLWFIKCVLWYIKKKKVKIKKKIILKITGLIKIFKRTLKYILETFKKYSIIIFLLKINLKYYGAKLKHFSTIKRRTRKRILKLEKKNF